MGFTSETSKLQNHAQPEPVAQAGPQDAPHSPLPFELVPGDENHGPYIVNAYGGDVCDFYVMSNPNSLSVRNGGDSKPIWFINAAANAELIVRALNFYAASLEAKR